MIVFVLVIQLLLTVLSILGGMAFKGKKGAQNALKLAMGCFYVDENKTLRGALWEGISRHTYQFLQTQVGYASAQFSNAIGYITEVDFWCGATFARTQYRKGSIAFGHIILLSQYDKETQLRAEAGGYTTLHEYGHYLQSQHSGFAYLFKYGIPSAFKKRKWTEVDANLRAARYFEQHFDFEWNRKYYSGYRFLYSNLPSSRKTKQVRWWEYLVFPFTFLWN